MSPRVLLRQLACVGALLVALNSLPSAQAPLPPTNVTPPLPSDEFFNPNVVRRLDLRVHTLDWEKLKQFFQENTYYPADVVWEGQTVHNVGIRSRGLGSRSATKPGLRVDMDRYSINQTFLEMKSFILDNLTQDHSGIHETVTMRLFARLGIPAPRETHVRLYVNNQYAGLYALVESIDKQFLARIFGKIGEDTQNDGFLYEFDYLDPWTFTYLGPTLETYAARFDPKTHENATMQNKFGPIEEVVRLANELPIEQYMTTLNARLDLNAFMRYVAAQNFVGQNDGFLGYAGMNNFYFYRKENSTQHVFLAWDEDNAFWGPTWPINMRHDENVLMQKCMQIPELRAVYYAVLAEAAAISQEPTGPELQPWLAYEVRRQSDLIQPAMQEDTKKPYSYEEHLAARQHMEHFSNERSAFVLQQMASQGLRRP